MNKLLSSTFRILIATIMVIVAGTAIALREDSLTVHAVGDLTVTFEDDPFFSKTNMAPGDVVPTKTITVENTGTVARMVAVRAHNIIRSPGSPDLDSVLTLAIGGDADLASSFSNLAQFLDDTDGVLLSILNPGQTEQYDFDVTFPSSAQNEYQGRSVQFDLTVGAIIADHLVINEVFYNVDAAHGIDCNLASGNNSASNTNTGPGSTNIASVHVRNRCRIRINNQASVTPSIVLHANTGGNSLSGNTTASNLISGSINVVITFNVVINQLANAGAHGQSDEWIELFNPTDQEISLKDWKIIDNSGIVRTIHVNKSIGAGEFKLLVKSMSTFALFWPGVDPTMVIEMGQIFGDGLDNAGDFVLLKNPADQVVDAIGWGTATPPNLVPPVPVFADQVNAGESIERLAPGFDNDLPIDFEVESPPTPGFD